MIELVGVSVGYGADQVLADVDLRLEVGQTLALVGPSGSGKSTLLRVILGLIPVRSGTVRVDGQDLRSADLQGLRHRIGYVVQDGGLFPHLTARANAELVARTLGWARPRIDRRLADLCALARLDPALLERLPQDLSGGQRQRVGLVRALMLEPGLLLLDEPLGALDPIVRSALQDELRTIVRALGATVVLVTHDLAEAAFFADRVAVLTEGRVAAEGPLDEVLAAPADSYVGRFVRAQRALHLPVLA